MSLFLHVFGFLLAFGGGIAVGVIVGLAIADSTQPGRHRVARRPEPASPTKRKTGPEQERRPTSIRVRGFIGHADRAEPATTPVVVAVDMDAVERALTAGDNGETAVLPVVVDPDATAVLEAVPVTPASMEAAA